MHSIKEDPGFHTGISGGVSNFARISFGGCRGMQINLDFLTMCFGGAIVDGKVPRSSKH